MPEVSRSFEGQKVVKSMDAGTVAAILGINIALGVIIWWRLEKNGLDSGAKFERCGLNLRKTALSKF